MFSMRSNGDENTRPSTVSTSAITSTNEYIVPVSFFMLSVRPVEKLRPISVVPPFAIAVTTTSITVVTCPPVLTAAIAAASAQCPIIIMSATL